MLDRSTGHPAQKDAPASILACAVAVPASAETASGTYHYAAVKMLLKLPKTGFRSLMLASLPELNKMLEKQAFFEAFGQSYCGPSKLAVEGSSPFARSSRPPLTANVSGVFLSPTLTPGGARLPLHVRLDVDDDGPSAHTRRDCRLVP
jgi:hypothetical protein